MNQSARRINALARKLSIRSYLEIGVQNGTTFRDIEIAERVAVDPHFLFEPSNFEDENTTFFKKTSDQFFSEFGDRKPFGVVFIDGLHVFEQVIRDFSNAIVRTNQHSIIILDDTVPNDVFSSLPTYDDAIRFRKATGKENGEWHGDVFKVVFYIHDFWQGIEYRTILGSGNPQTILWRKQGISRKPVFNSLEKISRLTYFDLQDYLQLLHPSTEEEAISLCVSDLATITPP